MHRFLDRLQWPLIVSLLAGLLVTFCTLTFVCGDDQVLVEGKSGYSITS